MNDYYYAIGRIRTLESRLLTDVQIARLATATDLEACFGILSETSYNENLAKLTSKNPEELFSLELVNLKDLLLKLSFNNPFIVSLLKKFDYANSKLLLRSSLAGKNENFQAAESMLDQAYYLELKESATKTASKLIKQFIAATIDLANLKNTLRLALTTKDKKTLKESIIKGGMISRELWLDLFYKQPQEIQTRLRFSLYFPYLNEGIESLIKTGSLVKLEKLADDFLVNQFHRAKYLGSGLEPLVGFFLAKEVEIKTLRFILTCKKQKVNAEKIKERIRINY